jgi:hypothetical protein
MRSTNLAKKSADNQINGLAKVHHLEVVHSQTTVKPFYVAEDAEITGKNIEGWYCDETTDEPTQPFKIRVIDVLNYIDQFIGTEVVNDTVEFGEHVQHSYEYPALQQLMDNTNSIVAEFLNAKGISHE